MSFFMDPAVLLGQKLLEIIYIIIGSICLYTAVKNAKDPKNPSRLGTSVFWGLLGIVMAFGRWIPATVNGVLILAMTIPPIFKKVSMGGQNIPETESTRKNLNKLA